MNAAIKIETRQTIAGPSDIRFRCHSTLTHKWPSLLQFAERVGATPVVELCIDGIQIYAKLEYQNPHGTVKDRAVLGMVHDLLVRKSRPQRILEYTGGSLGLSLATLCYQLRIPLTLVLSESSPPSVLEQLQALDCELVLIDKNEGFWGVMKKARELNQAHPEYSFLFQHENFANLQMHQQQTGSEFLHQLQGAEIDGWVAAVGTGGTYCGVLSAFRPRWPNIKGYIVTPSEMPFGTQEGPNPKPKFIGAGGLGFGQKQKFVMQLDPSALHLNFSYDRCRQMMLDVYMQTGLEIGSSAAANLLGCLQAHITHGHQKLATVFPSSPSYEETLWLQSHKEVHNEQLRSIITKGGRNLYNQLAPA